MNNRRKLIVALGAGALTVPFPSFAQQPGKVWRVGFLAFPTRPSSLDSHVFGAFARGMREIGYVEGRNLLIEWRFADGKVEWLPELAAELVRLKVDVIVVSASATRAAQNATATIPIVFAAVSDPVSSGLITSLARRFSGIPNSPDFPRFPRLWCIRARHARAWLRRRQEPADRMALCRW